MAIGKSAFFILIEVYELVQRSSAAVAAVLLLNGWIVWYLLVNRERLFRRHA